MTRVLKPRRGALRQGLKKCMESIQGDELAARLHVQRKAVVGSNMPGTLNYTRFHRI
ncbi:uncharacterized protein PHACADRAFT_260630 [Phanerochaete carnosa HHB-10118-sp]|uniref:Uncharacterized protein n=1 Tax=Phanerochaete carnosa (strain HHB-10118-sp) TaxID=650164 RepID=K5VLP5_PHACS|nr:uncharacterized protein PHACADRAFT_260630 [Phanerochaete carnosa HHB-10118-sp]EKM52313.1 hypothetical protein PHACADRAFT_260630 [Phanerochaete carnosa HHB-10118-sp]